VLNYPTRDQDAHLAKIKGLQTVFPGTPIGYSDHTLPKDMQTLLVAAILGACILEKHFTHDKSLPGNDHYHAMDKEDLRSFRTKLEAAWQLLGSGELKALPGEDAARRHARRSLVARRDIPAGKMITSDDLTWKRPGHGISPKDIDAVVGKKAKHQLVEDTIFTWDLLI
jgi:N-acetylneuraminate synthase